MDPGHSPEFNSDAFTCPHCRVYSRHLWWMLAHRPESNPNFNQDVALSVAQESALDITPPVQVDWTHTSCNKCGRWTMWRGTTMVYSSSSPAPEPTDDMPAAARVVYEEARAVAAVPQRAGAAMARTTLEYLLKIVLPDVDVVVPKGVHLNDLIALAETKVESGLARRLELVRCAGNKPVHVEDVPDDVMVLVLDDEDEAVMEILFSAINGVVVELITKRKQTEKLYDRLPEGVRASIESKREATDRG